MDKTSLTQFHPFPNRFPNRSQATVLKPQVIDGVNTFTYHSNYGDIILHPPRFNRKFGIKHYYPAILKLGPDITPEMLTFTLLERNKIQITVQGVNSVSRIIMPYPNNRSLLPTAFKMIHIEANGQILPVRTLTAAVDKGEQPAWSELIKAPTVDKKPVEILTHQTIDGVNTFRYNAGNSDKIIELPKNAHNNKLIFSKGITREMVSVVRLPNSANSYFSIKFIINDSKSVGSITVVDRLDSSLYSVEIEGQTISMNAISAAVYNNESPEYWPGLIKKATSDTQFAPENSVVDNQDITMIRGAMSSLGQKSEKESPVFFSFQSVNSNSPINCLVNTQ